MDIHNPQPDEAAPESSDWWHISSVALTGAAGGFFGAWALAVEVPVTTTIMMRSIADIARCENADLSDVAVQLECVTVLAMGGKTSSDDESEVGYFVAREALAHATAEAAAHIAKKGVDKEGAPALVRLIVAIAERYSINITEKAAAQAVPLIGAAGSALINTVFMDHFQDMARGHFIVRRLERELGPEMVQTKYVELRNAAR
ncbi:EcsC family protein [Massilia sp. BSC265]|uniref:EcsC family protein n=1 Tax=Massilia sp. BSC265 TaxID=1549812 RepID=UPI00068D3BE2|nr:EcsC family protein [Massilia sp. BSC265]